MRSGSTPTEYSPYVENPIELCEIETYADKLKQSTGKNLLNLTDGTYSANGITIKVEKGRILLNRTATSSGTSFIDVPLITPITLKANEAYTFSASNNFILGNTSQGGTYASIRLGAASDDSTTDVVMGIIDNSYTFHKTTDTTYTRVRVRTAASLSYSNNIICPQLEIGTTKTDAEPFGVGIWYAAKKVQKAILDSSTRESGGTTGTNAYYITTKLKGLDNNAKELSKSNLFQPVSFNNRANGLDVTYVQNGNLVIRTANNTTIDWSDNTKRDAWLNTNKPIAYYVLAATDQIVVNDNLSEQLNQIQNLIMQENKTNIFWTGELTPTMLLQYATNEELHANIITEDGTKIRTDWR